MHIFTPMNRTFLTPFATLLVLSVLSLASCSRAEQPGTEPQQQEELQPEQEPELPAACITETIRFDAVKLTAYNITYPSTDPYGKPATLSGTIVVGDDMTQTKPARGIMLYNHFTVNRADQCPSRGDLTVQKLLAGGGLIVVSADYYGFGITEDKPQAYCVASANAKASLDALLAAQTLLKDRGYAWADILFNAGYSQGAQTTVGVLKLASEQYPDIHFTHSFAGGGPYDISETARQLLKAGETNLPSTIINVLLAYNDVFNLGIAPDAMFQEPVLSHLDEWFFSKAYTLEEINDMIGTKSIPDLVTPELRDLEGDLAQRFQSAMEQENLCKGWTPNPHEQISIIHAALDDTVPVASAANLVQFFEDKGLPIVEELGQEGVYVDISTTGGLSEVVSSHYLGALPFVTDTVTQMSLLLGVDNWIDTSMLSDLFSSND